MMQLTVRSIDPELEKHLRNLEERERLSLNKTALSLKRKGASLAGMPPRARQIGSQLRKFAGTMSQSEAARIDDAIEQARNQSISPPPIPWCDDKPPLSMLICFGVLSPIIRMPTMGRLTINITDERQQALKEAAAVRSKTIGQIIEESLEAYGVKTRANAQSIVARARANAKLTEAEAIELATQETRRARSDQ